MLAATKIIFVGLCSFLNMSSSNDPNLPAASVILHRSSMPHTPFIAIDRRNMKVTPPIATPISSSNFDFILLDGQKLTINEDTGGTPTIDSSFKTDVARFANYSKVTSLVMNENRVPKRAKDPKSSEVAAYLLFGNGTVTADWLTDAEYTFKNPLGTATIGPKQFARRVTYTLSIASSSITIHQAPLDGSTSTPADLKFESTTGGDIQIWIGNSEVINLTGPDPPLGIKLDLEGYQPATPSVSKHFAGFYKSLRTAPLDRDVYIPHPLVTSTPGGGPSSGYCGPDSQP